MQKLIAWALVILAGQCCLADEAISWREYLSHEGRFRIFMPGTPTLEKDQTKSEFGPGQLFVSKAFAGPYMFAANYCDFPAEVLKMPLAQFYDSSRNGAVENLKGKLEGESEIKAGKYPGREIRIEVNEGKQLFRARLFRVGTRLYQVVVFAPKDMAIAKPANEYLDSFSVVE